MTYSKPVLAESMANCVKFGNESDRLIIDLSQQQYLKGFSPVDGRVRDSRWICGNCLLLEVTSVGSSHQREEPDNNQTGCQGFSQAV